MITLPSAKFGATDRLVSRVGLGGEGVLRTRGRGREAEAVIREALGQGITYFDTAPAYEDSQKYYGQFWKNNPGKRDGIFQTSKSAYRDAAHARRDLEETLSVMGLDHLDLWQIHDLRTMDDFERISGPGGSLEAFVKARQDGKVRHIGVTGHHDPDILTRAVREWPVDAVLLPVNPVEACLEGFRDQTIPAARAKGMAVIGMKALGGSRYLVPGAGTTAGVLIRFALAQDMDVLIVGCSSPGEVRTLAAAAKQGALSEDERSEITRAFQPHARRLAFYRGR